MKTKKELTELDEWIAFNVMGWHQQDVKPTRWFPDGWKNAWIDPEGGATNLPNFTTCRADAMAVLEKCLKVSDVHIEGSKTGHFHITDLTEYALCIADADSLPLAIALFAKQLFKKR